VSQTLSLIVREEQESRVLEKGVLRITFGPESEEVIARERKFIMSRFIILYCSILLHFTLNYDQFSVLCANTYQFFKFTFKIVKLLKFLKVLKITTCFGQYGHPQVLKSSGRNCCYSVDIACVPSMRTYAVLGVLCALLFSGGCFVLNSIECNREHNTPITTYGRLEGTHAISTE
jgi:hypothetical protein